MKQHKPLILASQSPARRHMLDAARLDFEVHVSGVNEVRAKSAFESAHQSATESTVAMSRAVHLACHLACHLAALKAARVSRDHVGITTIGADQTMECEGVMFDKPAHRDEARDHLGQLSGKQHSLFSAVAVARDGRILWQDHAAAHLTMRRLGKQDIDDYLVATGDSILSSVGCYRLEDAGSRLFTAIEGDYFTILGLPLLPLLAYLRDSGVID